MERVVSDLKYTRTDRKSVGHAASHLLHPTQSSTLGETAIPPALFPVAEAISSTSVGQARTHCVHPIPQFRMALITPYVWPKHKQRGRRGLPYNQRGDNTKVDGVDSNVWKHTRALNPNRPPEASDMSQARSRTQRPRDTSAQASSTRDWRYGYARGIGLEAHLPTAHVLTTRPLDSNQKNTNTQRAKDELGDSKMALHR